MTVNYKQCPNCGSKDTLKIIYGYPSYELFLEAEAGKVKLGGCCVPIDGPDYFCQDCKHKWNRKQAVEAAYAKIKAIRAYAGGYFGSSFNVEIDLVNRKTTLSRWSREPVEITTEDYLSRAIRKSTVDKFVEEMTMVNLLNWKAKYIEPGVCDGTKWSVEIITTGRTIRKYGDNKFPEEWKMFCRSVKSITKREFY